MRLFGMVEQPFLSGAKGTPPTELGCLTDTHSQNGGGSPHEEALPASPVRPVHAGRPCNGSRRKQQVDLD